MIFHTAKDAISHTSQAPEYVGEPIEGASISPSGGDYPRSYIVRESSANRTISRHHNGMSQTEREILSAALTRIRRDGGPAIYLTLEAHDESEYEARRRFDRAKADFGQMQSRAGDPRYMVEVLEGSPTVHSHIIGRTPKGSRPRDIIDRLKRSKVYGDGLEGKTVTDPDGLVNYLSKEATPQAHYRKSFRRKKGSHKLGDGGGDRVRLSKQLEADLVGEGILQPRIRTYRKRGLKKPPRGLVELETQLPLFPHLAKPISRVREFDHGIASPSVAREIEFHRKRRGLTQAELASLAGISRPQLANVIAGRFGLSPWPAARLRDVLLAEPHLELASAA